MNKPEKPNARAADGPLARVIDGIVLFLALSLFTIGRWLGLEDDISESPTEHNQD